MGLQLVAMSMVTLFVALSFKLEPAGEANVVALLAVLFGAVQIAIGCGFVARVFYLRKKCNWDQMRELRG